MLRYETLTCDVIGCAMRVHRELGPGLLESAYERCLSHELMECGMSFKRQSALPIDYRGVRIDCGYRIDLLVEDTLLLELKSIEQLLAIHEAQVLTYMKLACTPVGLLINFNQLRLKDGLKRFVL